MKKTLIALLGLMVSPILATRSVEEIKEDTRMIEYRVTIYRNHENFNEDEWKKTVDEAASAIQLATRSGDDENRNDAELVDTMLRSMRSVYQRSSDRAGIHGTISISMGDGHCPEGRCNQPCMCKEEYRGMCPCSLDISRSCKTGNACPCVSKSEGCNCPDGSCCKNK